MFFPPFHHRINPVNKFVAYDVENKPHRRTDFVLAFADFSAPADRLVVVLEFTLHTDRGHSSQVKQRLQPFTSLMAHLGFAADTGS